MIVHPSQHQLAEQEKEIIIMQSQHQLLQDQIDEIAKRPGNLVCAECPERRPAWASLIRPLGRGRTVGVFICQGCYKHHFRLGRHFCEVKSLTMAHECKCSQSITGRRELFKVTVSITILVCVT